MCQVNGGWSFSAPGAPKPLNRFTLNLACLIMSIVRPHMQNMVAAENGGWVGIWVKLYRCMLFKFYFGSFNASTACLEKCGFSLSAPKNVFHGGCVPLGSVSPGGQIFPFYPQNHFSMG